MPTIQQSKKPAISEIGVRELESFLTWHKTTKDWLREDRPFQAVFTYNTVLDYYQQIEEYNRANNRGDETPKVEGGSS